MTARQKASDLTWAVDGAPIGLWVTARGTADALMQDILCLFADGTGYLESRSGLRGEENFPVMWRHVEPGQIQLAMLLPEDDSLAEPEWETVRYASVIRTTDTGDELRVLQNTTDDAFWTLSGPIAFQSEVARVEPERETETPPPADR